MPSQGGKALLHLQRALHSGTSPAHRDLQRGLHQRMGNVTGRAWLSPSTAWLLGSYEGLISSFLSCQPWVTRVSCDSGLCQCVSVLPRMSYLFLEMRISDVCLLPRHVALMYGTIAQSPFYPFLRVSSSDACKGSTNNFVHTIIQSLSFAVMAKSDSWFRGVTFLLQPKAFARSTSVRGSCQPRHMDRHTPTGSSGLAVSCPGLSAGCWASMTMMQGGGWGAAAAKRCNL